MKFRKIFSVILAVGMMFTMTGCGRTETTVTAKSTLRATQLSDAVFNKMIDRELYELSRDNPEWELNVFDTYNHKNGSGDGITSVWHYTQVYALCNRMIDLYKDTEKEEYYKNLSKDLFNEFDWYKGTAEIVDFTGKHERTVYGVNRANKIGKKRNQANVAGDQNVYDDQMWIAREMLDNYKITGDKAVLDQAEYLVNYCLGGWDCSLNERGEEYGGILWGPAYENRHTCANGPIISPLVWLYEVYKDSDETIEYKYQDAQHNVLSKTVKKSDYYLDFAKKVYHYTYDNLKKANDLFLDSKGYRVEFVTEKVTNESGVEVEKQVVKYTSRDIGETDPRSLTYNSGAPISGACDLYRVTGDSVYLEQAKKMSAAAYDFFGDKTFKEGFVRYPTDSITTWFNFVLYRSFADLYKVWQHELSLEYVNSFKQNINYSYENFYKNGFLPRDVIGGWNPGWIHDDETGIMDQSSAAETMAMVAQLERDFKI